MTSSVVEEDDGEQAQHEPADPPGSRPGGNPNGLVVLPGGISVSYDEAEVTALAAALDAAGARPQERVLIAMPDGSGFAEAMIGTVRHGAVPLPVSPSVSTDEVPTVAAQAGARLAVVPARCCGPLRDLPDELMVPVNGPQGPWAAVLLLG